MVKAVFDELGARTRRGATSRSASSTTSPTRSLPWDRDVRHRGRGRRRARVFYGLGADGTVGANKNSIKIIGEETDHYAQGYFVYDSKKSGAITVSHLRFGPRPIRSAYLIGPRELRGLPPVRVPGQDRRARARRAGRRLPPERALRPADEVWDHLPREVQEQIVEKQLRFYAIDAYAVATRGGHGRAHQHHHADLLLRASPACCRARRRSRRSRRRSRRPTASAGAEVVRRNFAAVDQALAHLHEVDGARRRPSATRTPAAPGVRRRPPTSCRRVTAVMLAGKGDLLPGQRVPRGRHLAGGHRAVGEAQHRRSRSRSGTRRSASSATSARSSARTPRSGPRSTTTAALGRRARRPSRPTAYRGARVQGQEVHDPGGARGLHRLQPVRRGLPGQGPDRTRGTRRSTWRRSAPLREAERANYDFFLDLPELPRTEVARLDHKGSQFLEPLFEYSGACAGCGETPYLKLLTQLFGDRAAHRQRHRLLVDLRRQPAHHALHHEPRRPRARPGRTRSSRTTRSSASASAWRSTRTWPRPARCSSGSAPAARRRRSPRSSSRRDQSGEAGIAAQRERVRGAASRRSRDARDARGAAPRAARRLPREEERLARGRRRLGLRHRLRRPRPRARRAGATSTSWSSTPRSTPTPAASSRRPRRSGAAAKFAAAGKAGRQEGPGPAGHELRPRLRGARRLRGQDDTRPCRPSWRPRRTPARRSIIAYSHCIAHGYDMAQGADAAEAAPWTRASGRSTASTRGALADGRAAARSSTPAPPKAKVAGLHAQRGALPHGRARRPRALQAVRRGVARRRPGAATPSTSSSRGSACRWPSRERTEPPPPPRRRRRAHGPRHDATWACGCRTRSIVGSGPLADDLDTVRAARGRGGRRDRAALAVRGADRGRADGRVLPLREPRRVLRRGHELLSRARSRRSGPTSTSSTCGGSRPRCASR